MTSHKKFSSILASIMVMTLALPGGAVVWGRSIGALGVAMTIELAAIGVSRDLVRSPGD